MNGSQEDLIKYLNNPDTVDFLIKTNEYFYSRPADIPFVKFTQVLSDRYVISYINRDDIDRIRSLLGVNFNFYRSVLLGLLDREALEAAGIIQVQEQSFLSLTGRGVLIGVIDTGIDYTNPAFIYEDGTTKIQSIYDQSSLSGNPPEEFFIGTEYTREQINEALKSDDPYTVVPQRDISGHGTFLASIMASRQPGEYLGAAPDAEIVAVKLKKARNFYLDYFLVPPDQEYVFESSAFALGIEYVLRQGKKLDRPVAICISVGTNNGPHDGSSLLEQYLEDISDIGGICICAAAGNESQAKHHMRGQITESGGTADIELNVTNQGSGVFMSIKNDASDRLSFSLKSPSGENVIRVPAKPAAIYNTNLIFNKSKVWIEYNYPVAGNGGQVTTIRIQNAIPGIWTVTVYGDIIIDGRFDAYLPLTGLGYPGIEFLAPDPFYTIVTPATSISVISTGAYNSVDNSLYINSSWGPTRLPMSSPDLVAPGVRVGGIYPTGYGTMTGTSVAAAIATGAAALMLAMGNYRRKQPVAKYLPDKRIFNTRM